MGKQSKYGKQLKYGGLFKFWMNNQDTILGINPKYGGAIKRWKNNQKNNVIKMWMNKNMEEKSNENMTEQSKYWRKSKHGRAIYIQLNNKRMAE